MARKATKDLRELPENSDEAPASRVEEIETARKLQLAEVLEHQGQIELDLDQGTSMNTVLDRHVETTPGVRGGKPRISGTRITVADVVLMHLRLGWSLAEIAGKYDLSMAALYAAVAYYYDHQQEIDRSIEEDDAFAEAFRRNNPSLLQEKLKALSRG